MQARFLLGPAGSGKTFRCVAEVRAELLRAPDGPPLIFLAPKQATFQIERQLLGWGETPGEPASGAASGSRGRPPHQLHGYSRLHILSFERLAEFIFERLELPAPELLSEEGRVMVLRALLARHHGELKVFRGSARLTGFATQLSLLLREFQRSRVTPERLASLVAKISRAGRLNDKLHDLALLLGQYEAWLAARRAQGQHLDDANRLLDLATDALASAAAAGRDFKLGALWLDGFAEMTPQEQALLAALMPHCEQATLAFCLDGEPGEATSWLSPWAVVGRTFARCRDVLSNVPGCDVSVEVIRREIQASRFSETPALAQLERELVSTQPCSSRREEALIAFRFPLSAFRFSRWSLLTSAATIRLVACPNAEAEATLAARAILQHVQDGGRFRDCAVLVRSLDGYDDALRRILGRYEIPFFLDQREPVAHHPLAELTRYALRTVAFDWRQEDWFGALKTGFARISDEEVDWLENEALRRGWEGRVWRETFMGKAESGKAESGNIQHSTFNIQHPSGVELELERARQIVMPPFLALAAEMQTVGFQPTGRSLATAIRKLWLALDLEAQLEAWSKTASELGVNGAEHGTVWTQLNDWLDNLELAFADEALPLRDWLPILEAGLAGMTVGVIPPSLDQVLVGSVDRSRNPDLQIVFVLGVNEGVFPAPPKPGGLLTELDRAEIEAQGILLGLGQRQQIGHERYFGYIAFTRARKQLVVTWAKSDAEGRELNSSPFMAAIQRAVPDVVEENFVPANWSEALHRDELPGHILAARAVPPHPGSLPEGEGESLAASGNAFSDLVTERRGESRGSGESTQSVAGCLPLPEGEGSRVRGKGASLAAGLEPPEGGTPNKSGIESLAALDEFAPIIRRWEQAREAVGAGQLSGDVAARLYGNELATSVSALEDFTACPFHFLAARGLRAQEREEFVVDAREKGSFQHEVLQKFHERVRGQDKQWRDLTPSGARALIREIGEAVAQDFRGGLFAASEPARFTASVLTTNLERLMETLVGWAQHYSFDPAVVEISFGLPGAQLPPWRIELADGRVLKLRGRIDRVDLCRTADGEALVVICDYKSSGKQMDDAKLRHGLELQLLSYLAALAKMPEAGVLFGVDRLEPAGVFYVPLRGRAGSGATRAEADAAGAAASGAFQHRGRFDGARLAQFDNRGAVKGEQFRFKLNKGGEFSKSGNEAMPPGEFPALVDEAEAKLREIGERIFNGEAAVSPYRLKQETACDLCAYRAVCRFDPWTMPFRRLDAGKEA